MAAAPTFHMAITCLCDNKVEYYCNTCGDSLCSKCKAIHLKSKAASDHSVVPYGEKLRPDHVSALFCSEHPGKECKHWCEKCGIAACMDCVTSFHHGHEMMKLEVIIQEKTALLQKELANLESNVLKEWEDLKKEAKQMTTNFIEQVNGIDKDLDARVIEFHAKVDEIYHSSKTKLEALKSTNLKILRRQQKTISNRLKKVKQEIKECEDKLRDGSIESLLQYEGRKELIQPEISPVLPPIFSRNEIDMASLATMFGKLTDQQEKDENPESETWTPQDNLNLNASPLQSEDENKSENSTHEENQNSSELLALPTNYQTLSQLIPTPLVQSSFDSGFDSLDQSIVCGGSGQVWMKTGWRLKLMDQHGAVMNAMDTDFHFQDAALSLQGDLILSDYSNNCIKSISTDKEVKTLFRTWWEPCGLCCLHSGDIAVTFLFEGKVIIYSMSGKIVHELCKELVKYPYRVSQNMVNNDLSICHKDDTFSNVSSGKIVALDTSYNVRYEYTGQGETEFFPTDVCTDSMGHVLITDDTNNKVHILDMDGNFLQYLLTEEQGLSEPISISVDSEGNAWVAESRGEVKVLKYLQ